jgi:DNA-binding winged helix-turn-helix (wHTH) protein/TolB-like protein
MEGDFRVGEWLVQPKVGTISKGDHEVSLEPKVMEVLVYLARHTDDVLSKERIIRAVWGDTFVTDEVLTNAISELRRAFGDDAKDPHTIQTLPRRGYRLIAKVTPVEREEPDADTPASNQLWQQSVIVVLAAALLLVVVLILWWSWPASPDEPIDSIAVLPFVNISGDEDSEYLSDGIAASISSSLSQLPILRVLPSSALDRYRGQKVDPQTVSEELDVRAVLAGTIVFREETLVVRVELVDGLENRQLWGQRYRRELKDIFSVEEEIAQDIATSLRLQLTPEENKRLARRGTQNPKAYGLYWKGRFQQAERFRTKDRNERLNSLRKAIEYYERALHEDPFYARCYVSLSYVHQSLGFIMGSADAYSESRKAAEKTLEIDSGLAEAHVRMAEILAFYDHDWEGSEDEFNRAEELGASFSVPYLHILWLLWMGRYDEALDETEALERISDPLSVSEKTTFGYRYYFGRRFDLALDRALVADARYLAALCYQAKGMEKEAFDAMHPLQETDVLPREDLIEYRQAFQRTGMKGVWKLHGEKASGRKTVDIAGSYALAHEEDQAFKWLEKALELPLLIPFVTDARFDSLRDDPRFGQLLRKLKLPEEAIQRHLSLAEETPRR